VDPLGAVGDAEAVLDAQAGVVLLLSDATVGIDAEPVDASNYDAPGSRRR